MAVGVTDRPVSPLLVMARLRLTLLRRGLRGSATASWTVAGAFVGLLLAAGTIWAAFVDTDLVGLAMAFWMLGWIAGPLLSGGTETLRPEYFSALGLSRRRLTAALLAGSLVGFGPLVSLVAVLALGVTGVRAGVVAALVSIPVAAAQLLLFVTLSRVAVALYGLLLRIRVGAVLAGAVTGLMLAFAAQGWALVIAFVSSDVAEVLGDWSRIPPSGWGLVAIEAAADGAWPITLMAVAGMVLLSGVALVLWSALVARRTSGTIFRVRPRHLLRARTARAAAWGKELRSVARDMRFSSDLTFALTYALAFCLMPLAIGWSGLLPWAGGIFVVMATTRLANVYGDEGTGLWLLLNTPGAAGFDVRVRQAMFLAVLGPPALVLTVVLTALADTPAQWPYVAATLPAILGGGAGIAILLSVYQATPTTDPHRRTGNPLDTGASAEATGTMYLAMFAVILLAAPATVTAWLFGWWGLPTGVMTGLACWWWFGRLAARRLDGHGVELLTLLRHGRANRVSAPRKDPMRTLPARTRHIVYACLGFGAIPLFPQGVVPLVFLSNDNSTRVWFLAMYMPSPWSWVVAIAMVCLGIGMYAYGGLTYFRATRRAT